MRNVVCFGVLWLALIVESTVFQIPPLNLIQPNLVLICLVMVGLTRGPRAALILGVLIGFVQDVNFGIFIGLAAFTYGVVGYFSASSFLQFMHRNVAITLFVTVAFTFIVEWMSYGLKRMFGVAGYSWQGVMSHSLLQMMLNGVVLLLLYPWLLKLFTTPTNRQYVASKDTR